MKSSCFAALILLAIIIFFSTSCANRQTKAISQSKVDTTQHRIKQTSPTPIPGEYVVILKDNLGTPAIFLSRKDTRNRLEQYKNSQVQRMANLKLIKAVISQNQINDSSIKFYYTDLLIGFAVRLSEQQAKVLRLDQHVKGVYQNMRVGFQQTEFAWQKRDRDEFGAYEVERAVALAGGPLDGSKKDTWIWIIDSGIDLDHLDLNVQTDDPYAASFVGGSPNDTYGHGTMVAGLAAAKNNGFGTTGVSAGAVVVPIKVGREGLIEGYGADLSATIAGLDHVAQYHLVDDVVNMSLAYYQGNDCTTNTTSLAGEIRTAVANLGWSGVWVCCGAGNDADCNGSDKNVPGCTTAWRVYTIAGLTLGLTCGDYSNWGNSVDWAACGSAWSTYLDGKYSTAEGTSLATPIVSGIIHVKGGAPVSSGNVECCLSSYKIANVSPLSNTKFDVELELVRVDVSNVRDLDGTEDLFGKITLEGVKAFSRELHDNETMWALNKEDAVHKTNGSSLDINKRISIATNISFDELRNIELEIGADIADEEGLLGNRFFQCQECQTFEENFGKRTVKFLNEPNTLASINRLTFASVFSSLQFGGDQFIEVNCFESGNENDGHVKILWKVYVRPRGFVDPTCSSCHPHA